MKYFLCNILGNSYYKPYQDLFTGKTVMTGSSRIDHKNGDNISVISIDFSIKNLINDLFIKQDEDTTSRILKTHSVLFHVENNTVNIYFLNTNQSINQYFNQVYHHKDWNSIEGTLKKWQDLEFNNTIEQYNEEEKQIFVDQLEQTKNYSLHGQFNIDKAENITPFYQFWNKNDEPLQLQLYDLINISQKQFIQILRWVELFKQSLIKYNQLTQKKFHQYKQKVQ